MVRQLAHCHDEQQPTHLMMVTGLSEAQEDELGHGHTFRVFADFHHQPMTQRWTRLAPGVFVTFSVWDNTVTTMAAQCWVHALSAQATAAVAQLLGAPVNLPGTRVAVQYQWSVPSEVGQTASAEPCRGACFEQCCDEHHYVQTRACPCQLQPCPNTEFCHEELPQRMLEAHHGRCYPCNLIFGANLTFVSACCPMCLEVRRVAVLPRCRHRVCVECLGRLAFTPGPALPSHERLHVHADGEVKEAISKKEEDTEQEEQPQEEEYDDDDEDETYFSRQCPVCCASLHYDWGRQ